MAATRGNYRRYTKDQKQAAVQLASERSFAHASRELKIPESTIRTWKKTMSSGVVPDHKDNIGHALTYPVEVDAQIQHWVLQERSRGLPVSRAALSEYARNAVGRSDFQASDGWLRHFLRRHHLSLRTRTTEAQQLPADLQKRLDIFERYLREQRLNGDFDLVINMEETSSFFDMVPRRTVAEKGTKSVIIRTTGADKRHCTVVLAVSSDGATLPPLVIFKGKRWPSDIQAVPEGLFVKMQEKGWMDETVMFHWLETVLSAFTEGRKTLLIMDSFAAHVTPKVRNRLEEMNVTIAVIPGGCTSKIQPLDVSLNKPFKDHQRRSWTGYMSQCDHTQSRIPSPSRQHIVNWVDEAWTKIGQNTAMIIKSFEASRITGPLDEAAAELQRREDVLRSALFSDDSSGSFAGFTDADLDVVMDDETDNPFL